MMATPPAALLGILELDDRLLLAVIGVCLLVMLVIAWFIRRSRHVRAAVHQTALAPIVGRAEVTHAQLVAWHREHAESVKRWIESHEAVLERFADTGMSVDLTADLLHDHERLGLAISEAIGRHPEPRLRAELSGLVVASRDTLDSLRRSNWTKAKKDHVVYRRYRDGWLDRLHQSSDVESQLRGEDGDGLSGAGDVGGLG